MKDALGYKVLKVCQLNFFDIAFFFFFKDAVVIFWAEIIVQKPCISLIKEKYPFYSAGLDWIVKN